MGAVSSHDDEVMVAVPEVGRVYGGRQRVRLGDITPSGTVRLDAVARYLQDVANDDAYDSGIANPAEWVVRRTVIEVRQPAHLREDLELRTFCSGTGPCWAERRTSVQGSSGASIEAATLWVQVAAASGRPVRLDPHFVAVYGPSAAGRTVKARLRLTESVPLDAATLVFPLRFSDLDVLGHVNNAVYWSMVQECFAGDVERSAPFRVEVEHHHELGPGASGQLRCLGDRVWVCDGDQVSAAAVRRWMNA